MQMSAPILIASLIALAICLLFMALWLIFQKRDPVDQRLDEYGLENPEIVSQDGRAVRPCV